MPDEAPFLKLSEMELNKSLAENMPEKLARKYSAIALAPKQGELTLVMANKVNAQAIEDVQLVTEKIVHAALADKAEVKKAIAAIYGGDFEEKTSGYNASEFQDSDLDKDPEDGFGSGSDLLSSSDGESGAPIVKIVDLILMDSCKKGASDVHIEPFETKVRVRYRVDGHLQDALTIPKSNHAALLARMKIISNLDITENRIPQDGRFKMKIGDKQVDYRVSILPTYWGGKIVLRSLDKSNLRVDLTELGLSEVSLKHFETAISQPFGMIIVTGPTGSGKSTTLYSVLSELNSIDRNIITVEDPVEYQVDGITQVQAKSEIGMTFASALKAILRQSPDVVMIGEIRDTETADICVKAALTGQVVLSTLHTNDAAGAVVRLRDMGVESFLISSSLTLVAAQRLCRKICEHCKVPVEFSADELMALGFDSSVAAHIIETKFSKGKGCAKCGRSGCKGRVAITETFFVDEQLRAMIERGASSEELKIHAMKAGMLTLRTDALLKFAKGLIPVDEVIRVTTADE